MRLRAPLLLAAALSLATCRALPSVPGGVPGNVPGDVPGGVLLLVGDDHGRDDAGCYGHPLVATPALDGLAAEGLRFTGVRAITAICQPSRATLLTGLHPETNGVFGFYGLREGVRALPARLAEAGFFTGLVGKRHLVPFEAYGFRYAAAIGRDEDRGRGRILADVRGFFDALEAARAERFFLMVALHDPHRPFPEPGELARPIAPADVPVPPYLEDLPAVREEVAGYLGAVERLDRAVGTVLAELAARGRAEDTLVVYTSDHGAPFPFAKSTCYQAGLAVPFLVRWPGRTPAGATTDALVGLVDVAPTLLDAVGVEGADELEGRSFARLLTGGGGRHRTRLLSTRTDHVRLPSRPIRALTTPDRQYLLNLFTERPLTIEGVTTDTWAAMVAAGEGDPAIAARVRAFLDRPEEELYDLESDPAERVNLARDPAHAAELARLRAALLEELRAIDDPLLHVVPFATEADRARSREAYERWEALQEARREYEQGR